MVSLLSVSVAQVVGRRGGSGDEAGRRALERLAGRRAAGLAGRVELIELDGAA